MAWPNSAAADDSGNQDPAKKTFGKSNANRAGSVTDPQQTKLGSNNAPFAGYGGAKGFKPQYVGGEVSTAGASHGRIRGGRFGQGGFARVFQQRPGKPQLGAAGSGPGGALTGIFGI